ncbi:MAG: hypothetical protein U1E29_15600, partial [Coriobacteriia bacterium]|nr:hypothetical protein [Coriobacteriia bacterium]
MMQADMLKRMISALDEFRTTLALEVSHESVDFESVLEAHSRCHRELARSIRRLADEEADSNIEALNETAASIEGYLKMRLGDAIPSKYLVSGSPGKTRSVLLAYLLRNTGQPVSA